MLVKDFLDILYDELRVNFFTGVPDSQLKSLCDELYVRYGIGSKHIVAANEGAAVGIAAGHYIASGRPALVYLQNSGIGNILNPVASLLSEKVYAIPCVFVVGWRGEPGVKDEPQHVFQGEITIDLLELLGIKCFILSKETQLEDYRRFIEESKSVIKEGKSIALIVRKGTLKSDVSVDFKNEKKLLREDAIKTIVAQSGERDIFVTTTGKTSRELFEIRESLNQGHQKDFLTVGSMGHSSMIALGIALNVPDRRVWCIDGDGAMVMHLGSMLVLAKTGCKNLVHVVINNGAHESVGGMPVAYGRTSFLSLAKEAGYEMCLSVATQTELDTALAKVKKSNCICFIEIHTALGSREDLGRPTTTPQENKKALMDYIRESRL
jgi:phosphonopyruvate decarboxylase